MRQGCAQTWGGWRELRVAAREKAARLGSARILRTRAPRLGSPLLHLLRDWARPSNCRAATGSSRSHLRQDWTHPAPQHICTGTGPSLHLCRAGPRRCAEILRGTDRCPPPAPPHLHRDWTQPRHICSGTGASVASCRIRAPALKQNSTGCSGSQFIAGAHFHNECRQLASAQICVCVCVCVFTSIQHFHNETSVSLPAQVAVSAVCRSRR
jgi:hypothetical protein